MRNFAVLIGFVMVMSNGMCSEGSTKQPLREIFLSEPVIEYVLALQTQGCPDRPSDDAHIPIINHLSENEGITLLHWSYRNSDLVLFECLLTLGADPNILSVAGDSLINLAARDANARYLLLALENGGDPNVIWGKQRTPIFSAVGFNRMENMQILIDHGADLEVRDYGGATPILYGAVLGHWQSVYILLEAGADPDVTAGNSISRGTLLRDAYYDPNSPEGIARQKVIDFVGWKDPAFESN